MENNWPETVDELLGECQRLINKYDLYTLGERGKPFTGEKEPRVDGTEYLAGEYQYGVAMIPAQWVTHVIDSPTLGGGKLTAEQVYKAVMSADRWVKPMGNTGLTNTHLIICDDGWQAIADELNATLGGGECEMVTSGTPCDGNTDKACTSCGAYNIGEYYDGQGHIAAPKFCPECGAKVKVVKQ